MHRHAVTTAGIALLLVFAGCAGGGASPAQSEPTPESTGTIQVAGSGSADAEPNRAVVRVSVVAAGADASTARSRLAENVSRMRTALERAGVPRERIRTLRYDIDRDRRRPAEAGTEPPVQYRAAHDFEVTVTDPARAGTVIDTAVANGATEVDDVTFTLSAERRRALERRARSAAMADARSKARSLATDANLTVTGVQVIRTQRGGVPRPAGGDAGTTATAMPTAAPPTDLESGPVTVRTTIQVVYEAAPATNATAAG